MARRVNYKFVVDEEHRTVVCLSTFAGQTIRGVARCNPTDVFNVEAGKALAEARCAAKIAHKRLKRAENCVEGTISCLKYCEERLVHYRSYEADALEDVKLTTAKLKELEKNL
jgi:hypothetical protein